MDHVYGSMSAQAECFGIDDLLDLSNDDHFFSSSSSDSDPHHHHHHHHCLPPLLPQTSSSASASTHFINTPHHDFTSELCVPSDDVAELEWLSRFVDDSFSDLPAGEIAGALTFPNDASFSGRARSKRSRVPAAAPASASGRGCGGGGNTGWGSLSSTTTTTTAELESPVVAKPKSKQREASPVSGGGARRCTHCASEKTPQWRTGPMGPKTLCNACGVRYKSGRLVPEYRPAASPTFVLTQHSNSHRKVMELRRQKELIRQQQQPEEEQRHQQGQFYSHSQHHGFQVC